jgi:hypothetical protein
LSSQNQALALTGLNLQQQNQNTQNSLNFGNIYRPPAFPTQIGQGGALGGALQAPSYDTLLGLSSNLAGLNFSQQQGQAAAIGSLGGSLLGLGSGAISGGGFSSLGTSNPYIAGSGTSGFGDNMPVTDPFSTGGLTLGS